MVENRLPSQERQAIVVRSLHARDIRIPNLHEFLQKGDATALSIVEFLSGNNDQTYYDPETWIQSDRTQQAVPLRDILTQLYEGKNLVDIIPGQQLHVPTRSFIPNYVGLLPDFAVKVGNSDSLFGNTIALQALHHELPDSKSLYTLIPTLFYLQSGDSRIAMMITDRIENYKLTEFDWSNNLEAVHSYVEAKIRIWIKSSMYGTKATVVDGFSQNNILLGNEGLPTIVDADYKHVEGKVNISENFISGQIVRNIIQEIANLGILPTDIGLVLRGNDKLLFNK